MVDNACPERLVRGGRRPAGARSCESVAQRRLRLRLQPRRGGGLGRVRAAAQPGRARSTSAASARSSTRCAPIRALARRRPAHDRRRSGELAVDPAAVPAPALDATPRRCSSTALAPLAAWSDDAVRDLDAYERAGTPEWVVRLLRAAAPLGVRVRRRARRGLLPLLRGDRSASGAWPRRAGASATCPRAVASHIGRRSAPRRHDGAHPRAQPRPLRAQASRARSSRSWRPSGSRSAR